MTAYSVELTERAETDVERVFLWIGRRQPELAERWHAGFVAKLASLASMPGRCPVAREDDAYPDTTMRQLTYGQYRILYHIIEPQSPDAEGAVRILHVLHGAQKFSFEAPSKKPPSDRPRRSTRTSRPLDPLHQQPCRPAGLFSLPAVLQ